MDALYFAYGSNMHSQRMRSRVGSAQARGAGRVLGMRMKCNKLGRDGSGKANLIRDPDSLVWGVLWSFHASHWESLDRIEQGYRRIAIRAETPSGELLETETYVSSRLTADPVPFLSYKRWLEEGAREHDLPGPYRAFLEALPARPDPKTSA